MFRLRSKGFLSCGRKRYGCLYWAGKSPVVIRSRGLLVLMFGLEVSLEERS